MLEKDSIPADVVAKAEKLLAEVSYPEQVGETMIVDDSGINCFLDYGETPGCEKNWYLETHTLGCRSAAGTPEAEWWSEHLEIYDIYESDPGQVVLGDPNDGSFVSISRTSTFVLV